MKCSLALVILAAIVAITFVPESESAPDHGYGHGHGHGHGHKAEGTACIVKGSYCNCHYCKCEKGHVHCGGYGKGGYGKRLLEVIRRGTHN